MRSGGPPKPQHDGADPDLVAVGEQVGGRNRLARRSVPFLLPRSSRSAPVGDTVMRACRRETVGESIRTPPSSSSRPRMFSPMRNGRRPPSLINQQNAEPAADAVAGAAESAGPQNA